MWRWRRANPRTMTVLLYGKAERGHTWSWQRLMEWHHTMKWMMQ